MALPTDRVRMSNPGEIVVRSLVGAVGLEPLRGRSSSRAVSLELARPSRGRNIRPTVVEGGKLSAVLVGEVLVL